MLELRLTRFLHGDGKNDTVISGPGQSVFETSPNAFFSKGKREARETQRQLKPSLVDG